MLTLDFAGGKVILVEHQTRTKQMTSREAALEYHRLDVEGVAGASFARTYEDGASEADFDEYLRVLDLVYGETAAA
jgi:hypothetical protein